MGVALPLAHVPLPGTAAPGLRAEIFEVAGQEFCRPLLAGLGRVQRLAMLAPKCLRCQASVLVLALGCCVAGFARPLRGRQA
eukprot:14359840-Alexandrium_andersonii.AAC.1